VVIGGGRMVVYDGRRRDGVDLSEVSGWAEQKSRATRPWKSRRSTVQGRTMRCDALGCDVMQRQDEARVLFFAVC
jgi:hypothetical protein